MSKYSPAGIGRYEPPRNPLVESLNDFSDSVLKDVRDRRRMQFDAQEAERGRRDREALWMRQEEAITAREAARAKREDAATALSNALRFGLAPNTTPQEMIALPDGTSVNRYEPVGGTEYVQDRRFRPTWDEERQAAETRGQTTRLAGALGRLNDPSLQPLIDFGDPEMMREALGTRVQAPWEDARALKLAEERAKLARQYAPPRAPAAPRVLTVGGLPYQVEGGILKPMTLPDGTQPTANARPKSQFQSQREAFAAMATDALERLGDNLPDDSEEIGSTLGGRAATVGEQMKAAIPFIGNTMSSEEFQRRRAATYQIADAWLRYTSGAAVPEQEVERFSEGFTPQAGDKPETIADKRRARRLVASVLRGEVEPMVGLSQLGAMGIQTPRELQGAIMRGEVDPALEGVDPDIIQLLEELPE